MVKFLKANIKDGKPIIKFITFSVGFTYFYYVIPTNDYRDLFNEDMFLLDVQCNLQSQSLCS